MSDEAKKTGFIERIKTTVDGLADWVHGPKAAQAFRDSWSAIKQGNIRSGLSGYAEAGQESVEHAVTAAKTVGSEMQQFTREHVPGVAVGGGLLGPLGALAGGKIQDQISGGEHVNEPGASSVAGAKTISGKTHSR